MPCARVQRAGEPARARADPAVTVVPSAGLPPEVHDNRSNNNVHAVVHQGRTYLVFRTAKWHIASDDAYLYVVSTTDQQRWRFEGSFTVGRDLREARLMSWRGKLFLYPVVLPLGRDTYRLYNYTSPLDGPDEPWGAALLHGPRLIYRTTLDSAEDGPTPGAQCAGRHSTVPRAGRRWAYRRLTRTVVVAVEVLPAASVAVAVTV
jgi:hypothetical protein